MPSDEHELFPAKTYKFRRKRRFQGASWTPPSMSALREDGVWCPEHRQRHGYKTNQLGVYYEKRPDGKFQALWFCASSGSVLSTLELGKEENGSESEASD